MENPKKRVVMCVGTWPEDDYKDFVVFDVQPDETDDQAIKRAGEAYSPQNDFYIVEVDK